MNKVSFSNRRTPFYDELRKEVEQYFQRSGKKQTGDYRLYLKSIVLLGGMTTLYFTLLLVSMPIWLSLVLCGILGFNLALIGFNVMHDACHGSYSTNATLNEIMGYSMNLLGSNKFFWILKHNRIHHTYTNIDGVDDDINMGFLMRNCKTQKRLKMHRFQHIYSFLLYGFSSIFFVLIADVDKYFSKKISGTPIREIPTKEHVVFWLSKVFYLAVYIVIPIAVVGWLPWLVGYMVMNFIFGCTLSIVFQLAHVVEPAGFEEAIDHKLVIEKEWAEHQVRTTADFAAKSRLANWLLGGLNFQVVHHLFPYVSHVHYRSIQPIVKEVCARYNISYNEFRTFPMAVASHVRHIRELGQRD